MGLVDRLARRLTYALNDYRTIGLEGYLAFSAMTSGLWVVSVGFTHATLLHRAPQFCIGAAMLAHGVWYFRVLTAELIPSVPRSAINRDECLRAAIISVCMWATIFASFVLTPPRTVFAIPLTFANMVGALWAATRLSLKRELDLGGD